MLASIHKLDISPLDYIHVEYLLKITQNCPRLKFKSLLLKQGCRKRGAKGAQAPQFLADQLTLSQPEGAHSPHPVLRVPPPRIFRPCDVPALLLDLKTALEQYFRAVGSSENRKGAKKSSKV